MGSRYSFNAAVSLTLFLFAPLFLAQAAEIDGKEKSASPSGHEDTQKYIQRLERRVSDLEKLTKKLLEGKQVTTAGEEKQPIKIVEDKREVAPSAKAEDEWGAPVAEETAKGRDEAAGGGVTGQGAWRRRR